MNRRRSRNFEAGLANFALTLAKVLLVMAVVMMLMISDNKAQNDEGLKPKVEFMLSISWPGDNRSDNDVDIWVQNPDGQILFYGNREVGFLSLDHDDQGLANNVQVINGQEVVNETHEENVAFHGFYPGEYVVNVQLFRSGDKTMTGDGNVPVGKEIPTAIPVEVKFTKINPNIRQIMKQVVLLKYVKQEIHVFRFTMTDKGEILNLRYDMPTSLVDRQRKHY